MVAQLLNGEALAKEIRTQITEQIALRSQAGLRPPKLSVILVGDDDASTIYVRLKRRDCHEIGIQCDVLHFSHSTSEERLCQTIRLLNSDPENDGILLQLPLPPHISPLRVIELIDPTKDVDGITPHNMGMLTMREPAHRCCTPKGVMSLLSTTGKELRGSHACVIGASNHVGRPMCLELLLVGCTVTVTHKFTRDTPNLVTQADIVVSATGKAKLVTANWIKPGAIVIDVGIERQKDGSISGDVDFESVKQVAGWITPVPGRSRPDDSSVDTTKPYGCRRARILLNALLISDLHLDDSTVDAFAALEKTLAAARQMRDDVYILGDLVEVWIGDDDDSALATRVRTLLRSYSDDIRIRFMHGNRDFLIGEQFAQDTQIEILPDPYELEIDGLNVLLSHGDSLCTDDTKYQQMRNLFRSSEWQHNILKQTLEDRRVFAQSLRDQSRRENSNKAQYIMDVNDTATIELVRKYQADILIHGHTHRPGKHSLHNGKIRYVLGDWFSVGWLARISNRSITLECFRI